MLKSPFTALVAGTLLLTAAIACADDGKTKVDASSTAADNSSCLTQTGSRIPVKGKGCMALGHVVTQHQIQLTGATTVANALRLSDPTLTVHQ